MKKYFLTLPLVLSLIAPQESFGESTKEYFDMPVKIWLKIGEQKQIESVTGILSLTDKRPTKRQVKTLTDCMRRIGTAPEWISMDVGSLLTKCRFVHQMTGTSHKTNSQPA